MNTALQHGAATRADSRHTFPPPQRETVPAVIDAAKLANLEKNGTFAPLDRETRAAVDTETAAYHLSRQPQTLRVWACKENGPIRPLRVHGRLAWKTADLRALLGLAA